MREWRPLLLLPLALAVMPARAQPDSTPASLSVGYTLSFWDIDFGHTNYDVALTPGGYSATAHFETGLRRLSFFCCPLSVLHGAQTSRLGASAYWSVIS